MSDPQDTAVDDPGDGIVIERAVHEFIEQGPFKSRPNRAAGRAAGRRATTGRGRARREIGRMMRLQRTLDLAAAVDPDQPAEAAVAPARRGRS